MKSGRYIVNSVTEGTTGPQIESLWQDEGKAPMCRGRRCLLMKVCLGLICVLLLVFICVLLVFITLQHITMLKSYKNTVEEFNHTIISLQDKNTDLMTEKDQLKSNFNCLSQKKLELAKQGNGWFFISNESKSWSESRQFCRDRGADLIIINTEEKQRLISSVIKESVWIGLSDIENEGNMAWVNNSPLKQGFWDSNEPNDVGGNEDCIELNPAKPGLDNWNDIPCSDKRNWVCEN